MVKFKFLLSIRTLLGFNREECPTNVETHAQYWSERCRTHTWVVRSSSREYKQLTTMGIIIEYIEDSKWFESLTTQAYGQWYRRYFQTLSDEMLLDSGVLVPSPDNCQTIRDLRYPIRSTINPTIHRRRNVLFLSRTNLDIVLLANSTT